ncbi:hypothetical protein WAK64_10885 [Bacillus spongiae]|uniref:Uncharacterized protein n=1 Tax=Bacillus spongiae TaxID=2683610 RepID=A0ABU8HEB3_9BACI
MTLQEEKVCCACKDVRIDLYWLALSNNSIITTALLVLGFGELWFAMVDIPTIVVLIIRIIFAVITLFLIAKFVRQCLKEKNITARTLFE